MNWETLAAIAGISSLGTGAIITLFNWVFRARDSDQNLKRTLDLLAVNLENQNRLYEREFQLLRSEVADIRATQKQNATRMGKRISNTKIILLKFINYFNTRVLKAFTDKDLVGFEFVDLEGDEEN